MALGTGIIKAANPKGHFDSGYMSGTPKPGTCLEIVPATALIGGRPTWRAVSRSDGAIGPVAVLIEDHLQGFLMTTAWVTGKFIPNIYWPIAGEELNMLVRDQPGTGTQNVETIGDLLEIDGASGMLQAIGTTGPTDAHESKPFMLMEHRGLDVSTDTHCFCKYLGNQA